MGKGRLEQEQSVVARFIAERATEHNLVPAEPERATLAMAVVDYWRAVAPTGLVQKLYLGYEASAQTFHVLTLLRTDWVPGPPLPPTPEQRKHRKLFSAELAVWRQHRDLRIAFHPAPPHRFPGQSIEAIFRQVISPDILVLGQVPVRTRVTVH